LRELAKPQTAPVDWPTDFISTGKAAQLIGCSKKTILRLCPQHPIESPDGFALWALGVWKISRSRFRAFACRREKMSQ
jgi:hypothetical protein